MCLSLISLVVGTAISAASSLVGAMATGAQAKSEAAWQNWQLNEQNKQLEEERQQTRLQAEQTENARIEQTRRMKAVNQASMAVAGVAENTSYLQGTEVANDRKMREDIGTLRLNTAYGNKRISDQIAVNKAEGQFATAKAKMTSQGALISGILGAGSSIAKGFNDYNFYKVT